MKNTEEINKWLQDKKYQTESGEQEYKMYYDVDMPKILEDYYQYRSSLISDTKELDFKNSFYFDIKDIVESAHRAGQSDAGINPSVFEAMVYFEEKVKPRLFLNKEHIICTPDMTGKCFRCNKQVFENKIIEVKSDNYKERYEKIKNSEWFKNAYKDKSLGESMGLDDIPNK